MALSIESMIECTTKSIFPSQCVHERMVTGSLKILNEECTCLDLDRVLLQQRVNTSQLRGSSHRALQSRSPTLN